MEIYSKQLNNRAGWGIALLLGLAAIAVRGAAAPSRTPADSDITAAIEHEFLLDEIASLDRIGVHTEDGIVTLTGTVPSLVGRQRAEELAGIVKGVRSIVDRIEVTPPVRSAESLRADVLAALRRDPVTDVYEIDVGVDDAGVVTLMGTVDSRAEYALAEQIAMTVPGSTAVDNELDVNESRVYRGETDIADDIEGRARWDVRVDDSLIDVLVLQGGRVVLSGTVGSLAEKRHMEGLAWVAGVTDVDATHLNVERWARDDDLRRGKYEPGSEEEREAALRAAFAHDPRVVGQSIDVRVEDGTVWLTGTAENLFAKQAAEDDARNTVGVDRVVNELEIESGGLTDGEIARLVESGLRGIGLALGSDVSVSVADRQATLEGDVESMLRYWQIERTVSSVRGVDRLDNKLTVRGREPTLASYWNGFYPKSTSARLGAKGKAPKTDRELFDDIRSELFWSPFVDEDSVEILVDNGAVTLQGTVGSRREAQAARDNALEAGALSVRNDLEILE